MVRALIVSRFRQQELKDKTVTIQVLDPSHESEFDAFVAPSRIDQITGKRIAMISNGKQGTGRFFDALAEGFESRGANILRLTKHNYSAPAEAEVMAQATQCDVVIAGIGD